MPMNLKLTQTPVLSDHFSQNLNELTNSCKLLTITSIIINTPSATVCINIMNKITIFIH